MKFSSKTMAILLIATLSFSTIANATSKIETDEELTRIKSELITEKTIEEKEGNQSKLKQAEEYQEIKIKQKGYNSMKTVSVYADRQYQDNYCGPAVAYNIIKSKDQPWFAEELRTAMVGTYFPGRWTTVLNKYKPGNNYQISRGTDYSSLSEWRSKLKSMVIYTIDKGYPLVADCEMVNSDSRLHSKYSYGSRILHYVTVYGYDDRKDTIPAEVAISDSNNKKISNTYAIPSRYWTSLDKLKSATKPLGVVW